MKQHFFILLTCFFVSNSLLAQYTMSNQTVYDCVGTLTDSEANTQNPVIIQFEFARQYIL